jgi:hypothetical protein
MTMNRIVRALLVASVVAFTAAGSALAQCPVTSSTAVTTYHYDNLRTGWNCNETILTPAIVGSSSFGLLSTTTLDAQINAQPLFVPGQNITAGANLAAGAIPGTYDVVYVATEANSIYAIDASTGNVLLHKDSVSLGTPVWNSNLPVGGCGNGDYWYGINSTPVIDLANNVMYVIVYNQIGIFPLSSTKQTQPTSQAIGPSGPHVDYYLHELDLGSLDDVTPPVLVSAQHLLDNATNAVFDAHFQQQRPALLLVPGAGGLGNLYAGFGSFCDADSRGWLLGWQTAPSHGQASPLAGSQLNNTQPVPGESSFTIPWSALLSSIWMSGFGIAADAQNNLYFVAANSNLGAPTYDAVNNPSNSVMKVSSDLTNGNPSRMSIGFFTPSNHNALDAKDWDFGSGGVTLLPDQPGATPHLAVAAGKDGIMYLIDRDSLMGGTSAVALDYASIGQCFCGQSYFQTTGVGHMVMGQIVIDPTAHVGHIVSSGGANIMVWQVVTSPPASTPFPPYLTQETSLPLQQQGWDGGFFTSVSSNGEDDMIIWAVPRPNSTDRQVWLYAFAATQVPDQYSYPFWVRTQLTQIFTANAGTWTNPLLFANANIVPVVANGKVFVASYGLLDIFGILPPPCTGVQCARQRAPTQVPGAPQTLKPSAAQTSPHEVFGAIGNIDGSQLTIRLRSGKLVQIDATTAIEQARTTELYIGRSVAVQGTYDAAGTLHADHIYRVKAPATWPADR